MNKIPEKPPKNGKFPSVIDGSLIKKAEDFNKRYLYWSELKYRVEKESDRKKIWKLMKFLRSRRLENLSLPFMKISYTLTNEFMKELSRFDKFLAGNVEGNAQEVRLGTRYIMNSLMEEAIASSQMEGAATTRKVAKNMLRSGRKPKGLDERMILNNYEAINYILSIKGKKITLRTVMEIQEKLTRGTLEKPSYEGTLRKDDETVVGHNIHVERIVHYPPSHKKLAYLMEEFCKFANNEDSEEFIHPVIKGIALHFLIGYIHPFKDGNGRTARSIFYWYMLSQGYWLFEYMPLSRIILRSRNDYDLAYVYTEFDQMDLTYFIKYNIKCISKGLDELMEYAKKKREEQKEIKKVLYQNAGLNLRQSEILREFMENPYKTFTIKEVSITYKIVFETARTDLQVLTDKGFLKKKISGKKFLFSLKGKD